MKKGIPLNGKKKHLNQVKYGSNNCKTREEMLWYSEREYEYQGNHERENTTTVTEKNSFDQHNIVNCLNYFEYSDINSALMIL